MNSKCLSGLVGLELNCGYRKEGGGKGRKGAPAKMISLALRCPVASQPDGPALWLGQEWGMLMSRIHAVFATSHCHSVALWFSSAGADCYSSQPGSNRIPGRVPKDGFRKVTRAGTRQLYWLIGSLNLAMKSWVVLSGVRLAVHIKYFPSGEKTGRTSG